MLIKKYGTVLYKTNGDLLVSLSYALGAKSNQETIQYFSNCQRSRDTTTVLTECACIVNDLHQAISNSTNNPSELCINEFMTNHNQVLSEFLD